MVAEVGSLTARAKMAIQFFVWRVFAVFATNAPFLRVIATLQICFSIMQYIPCNSDLLAQETLFLIKKSTSSVFRDNPIILLQNSVCYFEFGSIQFNKIFIQLENPGIADPYQTPKKYEEVRFRRY